MEKENQPSKKEKLIVTLGLLFIIIIVIGGIYLSINHFLKDDNTSETNVNEVTTIDLESNEGKDLVNRIESKYGNEIYFLKETKVVDFTTLSKVEKICLGLGQPDITVTIDNQTYPGYTETQILNNLKNMFDKEIKIDPLEEMGTTLIYQEICPSSVLNYSSENAAYYTKPLELTEPLPDIISKINRIERQDDKLIVYGSAIFRDSKGIVYKDLDDKTAITDFELNEDGKTFQYLSSDGQTFEYYLQNSYQYIFTLTDDENLYWISYERSEQ